MVANTMRAVVVTIKGTLHFVSWQFCGSGDWLGVEFVCGEGWIGRKRVCMMGSILGMKKKRKLLFMSLPMNEHPEKDQILALACHRLYKPSKESVLKRTFSSDSVFPVLLDHGLCHLDQLLLAPKSICSFKNLSFIALAELNKKVVV